VTAIPTPAAAQPAAPAATPAAPAATPVVPTPVAPEPTPTPTPKLVVPPPEEPTPTPAPVEPKDGGDTPPDDPAEPEAFDLNVPETMLLDEATTAKLIETARAQNLTAAQTQALLDSVAPSLDAAQAQMLKETREGWAAEIANDPKFGGERLPQSEALRDSAVRAFGDEALKELLNAGELPLGQEPAVFRFLAKIGAAITEPPAVQPGANGAPLQGKSISGDVFKDASHAASVMYGDSK